MTRAAASALLRDQALSLGLLGGTVIATSGLVGYIVVPWLAGEERYLLYAAMGAGFDMPGYPLRRHVVALLLPSFGASFVGTLLTYRRGPRGLAPAAKLLGGVFGVPVATVLLAYLLTAVAFGAATGVGLLETSPLYGVLGAFLFTAYALVFGLLAVALALAVVVPAVSLGATCGFLLAHGLVRLAGATVGRR